MIPAPLGELPALLVEALAWIVAAMIVAFVWVRVVKLEEKIAEVIPTKLVLGLLVIGALWLFGVIPSF